MEPAQFFAIHFQFRTMCCLTSGFSLHNCRVDFALNVNKRYNCDFIECHLDVKMFSRANAGVFSIDPTGTISECDGHATYYCTSTRQEFR